MWAKDYNILVPTYVVVRDAKNPLHFYLSGEDKNLIQDVADSLVEFLNFKKKSKHLRVRDRIGEYCVLENGIKVGVAGSIKKANNISEDNAERREFLKTTIKTFN